MAHCYCYNHEDEVEDWLDRYDEPTYVGLNAYQEDMLHEDDCADEDFEPDLVDEQDELQYARFLEARRQSVANQVADEATNQAMLQELYEEEMTSWADKEAALEQFGLDEAYEQWLIDDSMSGQ